nr:head maturation protease, ClpP-related [uncultured Schaedlerella sp.]
MKTMQKMRMMNQPTAAVLPNQRSSPANHKFWNFMDNGDTAELQLFGQIQSEEDWWSDDCVTYRDFINELNALGNKKSINVVIHSVGGDVFAANAIYSALVMNKASITGTIIGICASAATIVLMACENRRIAKNGILMAHNPSVSLWGSYQEEELLKLAEVTSQVKKSMVTSYMERLDKTEDEINQLMDEETWYVGQEAVDAGFCDSVIEADVQNSIFSNKFMVDGIPYSFKNYVDSFVPDNIRKKVQALSGDLQKESGTFFNTSKNITQKGKEGMDGKEKAVPVIADAAGLKAAYPQLCAQIAADAVSEERERLKDIDAISNGIPEEMVMKAKYEEPISAADLAYAQLKANQAAGQKFLNQMVDEMQNSGTASVGSVPNTGYDPEGEKKVESEQKVAGLAAALKKDKRRR